MKYLGHQKQVSDSTSDMCVGRVAVVSTSLFTMCNMDVHIPEYHKNVKLVNF